jgi:membrane-associated phospholipid phosphatase
MKVTRLRTSLIALAVCAAAVSSSAQDLAEGTFQLPEPTFQAPPSCSTAQCEPASPASTVPSVADIFKSSVRDFKALPTRSNLILLGVGFAASSGLAGADKSSSVGLSSSGWAQGPFAPTGVTGQFPLHVAAGFAAYGLGRATGSSATAVFGADLIRAQILAQTTTQGIKYAVGRARPDGSGRSFPSGHTSTMFATATVIQQHFGWKAGIPAYAAASWVAAGRIHDKRHYLSDVAFGAALGIVAGRTVTVGSGRGQFEVAPISTPGGMGIGFTRVP